MSRLPFRKRVWPAWLYKRKPRRRQAAGGGGTTVGLSGVGAAGALGAFGKTATKAFTGVSAAGALGLLNQPAPTLALQPIYGMVEFELNGFMNGWVDVTADVIGDIRGSRGMQGSTAKDRVAKVGIMTLIMNNSEQNSAKKLGYYTHGHANCRTGFEPSMGVRFSIVIGGVAVPQFTGRLQKIAPTTNVYGERRSFLVVVDFMNETIKKRLNTLELQVNIPETDAFNMILATMPLQPRAVQAGAGTDTIPFIFDTTKDDHTTPMGEFVRLSNSTLALIYVKASGTFVYEPRGVRAVNFQSILTLGPDDYLTDNPPEVESDRSSIVNRVTASIHPRTLGTQPDVILYEIQAPFIVQPNSNLLVRGFYTEEGLRVRRAGGLDMLPAEPLVDYLFNTQIDGMGTDVTADAVVDTIFTANSVLFTINTQIPCYCIKLQSRGTQVIDNADMNVEAQDAASIEAFGEVVMSLDMPYNADPVFGNEVVQYFLFLAQSNQKRINKMPMLLNSKTTERALLMARREISDRVSASEPMTALSLSASFINAISFELTAERKYTLDWLLTPSDSTNYWFLEIPGFSELGLTTRLGFGLIIGHTDIAHLDSHADVAHGDVAHSDTHGDVTHEDAAHADSTHSDVAHQDVAHSDVTHSDIAHQDGTNTISFDDSHADVAHYDSHGDGGIGHLDSPSPPSDFHGDYTDHADSHGDNAHGDGHVDIPHTDQHFDSAHGDVAHGDVNHSDSHGDAGHGDAGHADVTHTDSHGDTDHTDSHGDTHEDRAHGDQN